MARLEPRNRQGGAALLLVVWVVALLSLLAAAALLMTTTSTRVAQAALDRMQLEAAVDGAVNQTLLEMADQNQNVPSSPVGASRTLDVGGAQVAVEVQDEAGKVDANRASPILLKAVLAEAGGASNDAGRWLAAIVKFRGDGENTGATSPTTHTGYGRVFRNLDELENVAGIPEQIMPCLETGLTVYSGLEMVDRRYTGALVLRALQRMAPGISVSATAGSAGQSGSTESFAGRVLGITATAHSGNAGFRRHAVVRITGDNARPVMVAEWSGNSDQGAPNENCGSPSSPVYAP